MKTNRIIEICTALIVLLFAYTAVSKVLDYDKFVFQMRLAPVPLMLPLAPVLGILVPATEILIVTGLLIRRFRLAALYATIVLLTTFEIYIAAMLLTGHHLPCTCGGIISKMGWGQHLLFNLLFIGIASAAIIMIKNFSRE